MQLARYFANEEGAISFTEEQASAFAKGVAGDFNPIHNPGGRRFCVPGDLLFCVLLHHYGVAQTTAVQFTGMLDGKTRMHLPGKAEKQMYIVDSRNRALLSLFMDGTHHANAGFVSSLSQAYVMFSGQTFPDILVPLMRSANVMINPDRPMVIYKDMAIELEPNVDDSSADPISLNLANTDISADDRKGAVRLRFNIHQGTQLIGVGEKNMVLSGWCYSYGCPLAGTN